MSTPFARLEVELAARFGAGVLVAAGPLDGDPEALFPEEREAVRRAVGRRRAEFATGRHAARRLIAALGVEPGALPVAPDRSPVWPAGVVGSISHTEGLCAVAVASSRAVRSIGLDVEGGGPLAADLFRLVLTPRELAHLEERGGPSRGGPSRGELAKVVFSAKEALYKLQHPITRMFLGFMDVEVELDPAAGRFRAEILKSEAAAALGPSALKGFFLLTGGWVVSGMVL